jgi:hypothetical protein
MARDPCCSNDDCSRARCLPRGNRSPGCAVGRCALSPSSRQGRDPLGGTDRLPRVSSSMLPCDGCEDVWPRPHLCCYTPKRHISGCRTIGEKEESSILDNIACIAPAGISQHRWVNGWVYRARRCGDNSRRVRNSVAPPWMFLAMKIRRVDRPRRQYSAPFQVGVSLCSATNAMLLIGGSSSKDRRRDGL